VVLQKARSVEAVIFRAIDERATHRGAAQYMIVQILPPHRERSQVPAVRAGDAGSVCVFLLMAAGAIQSRDAFPFRASYDVGKVAMAIVSLLRVVGGCVAVDAARVGQH
jgi:hypothetical protein